MKSRALRRVALAASVASTSALVLAGCSGGGGAAAGSSDEEITLTVATFNDFGYTDELLNAYTAEHPNVKIVHNRAAKSNDARANYFQKLGKTGLADIEAIEVDWLPEVMKYSDLLAPVPDDLKDRWLDWKSKAATDSSGNLIGYGTDIGPEAICYRADLFEAAGLPSDPAEVAAALQGDWSKYFEMGDTYVAATGKPFFDSASSVYQGMINQVEAAYEDPDTGEITATTNPEVKKIYTQTLDASKTQSAHFEQWSTDWYAGMANGAFATLSCPGWMLTQIEGNAPEVSGWKIADVFPNGGGNWGGSYLTVPANGPHVAEAQALADWLTSPEQQVKFFEQAGTFPSQVDALKSPELLGAKNAYFGDAAIGEIFTNRANAVSVTPFKGQYYFQVNDAMSKALLRVDQNTQDAQTSWDQWVSQVDAIG
ncbi:MULTISPECIES: extracellular solute-binding protein [Microbacterium]|uniref:ABC transporter substrate-binding protein n=1 Tax=Microbacterium TaxID=33882 RepID=UPI0027895A23|nr:MULTISPECIES: extracellular solute-binding protein [Microbacterium]MDQ1074647.1 cellobiose transport system substrate-binding protein [Microbacterium sp. SORGH_AS_0969]MDQ1114871.1 cellobiose transport system substrate-binding protein [Microbacterium testaceum]